ncbi:hypothetical protein HDV05_007585 [Chytridiales sp. JEL 0842]|nr:hypothetical protein HDV05_007585 [Chytridiales sp. JEL 0842]
MLSAHTPPRTPSPLPPHHQPSASPPPWTPSTPSPSSSLPSQVPESVISIIELYEDLTTRIFALYASETTLPVKKRHMDNLRTRMEVEQRELIRWETEKKGVGAEWERLRSGWWSPKPTSMPPALKSAFETACIKIEKMRSQIMSTQEQLSTLLAELEKAQTEFSELEGLRESLLVVVEQAFEEDKGDLALRLQLGSCERDLGSAMDALDRHMASETELKAAVQLIRGAIQCLRTFAETEDEAPEWFRAKILFDAKFLSTRADTRLQNAYALNLQLPPLPSPSTPPPNLHGARAALERGESRLRQVLSMMGELKCKQSESKMEVERLKGVWKEVKAQLCQRRVGVLEGLVRVLGRGQRQEQEGGGGGEGAGAERSWRDGVDPLVFLPVEWKEVPRGEVRPLRIVENLPVRGGTEGDGAEGLPEYVP